MTLSSVKMSATKTVGYGDFVDTNSTIFFVIFKLQCRLKVHRIHREYIEHSKTGLRSSLAALEAEI